MKTLYIECNMGAAGDMMMSALLELHPDPNKFLEKINNIGIPDVTVKAKKVSKCGIHGTHIDVEFNGETEETDYHTHLQHNHHHHSGIKDIKNIVDNLNVSDKIKSNAYSIYQIIAKAEAFVHQCDIENIHFHELGTMDAVTDIVGVCLLMDELAPEQIIASPVCTGYGNVKCAHGILPVPAPATAYILKDIPIFSGKIESELCTPTGAALIKFFADKFENMPHISISKIGYGMGTKDFEAANCMRVMLGDTSDSYQTITQLACNIDDMTPEEIGFVYDILFENGALDVFITPIQMKKNRPAVLLTCICENNDKDKLIPLIFKYTSTIGLRENICNKYILKRNVNIQNTKFGPIRFKESYGYGIKRSKPEYDDLVRAARENNLSISDILKQL